MRENAHVAWEKVSVCPPNVVSPRPMADTIWPTGKSCADVIATYLYFNAPDPPSNNFSYIFSMNILLSANLEGSHFVLCKLFKCIYTTWILGHFWHVIIWSLKMQMTNKLKFVIESFHIMNELDWNYTF